MTDRSSRSAAHGGLFGRGPQLIIVIGLCAYTISEFGPVFYGPAFASAPNWPSFLAASLAVAAGMTLLGDTCRWIAGQYELSAARTPAGHKGKARFAELHEIEHELTSDGWGPYWGSVDGMAITSAFASNALVIGPPGSKKSVGIIVPTIWSIRGSKVVKDFKSELACILAKLLRARGEKVIILNIADINADILGPSATYNPPNLIADNFFRSGGLRDVSKDGRAFFNVTFTRLYTDPKTGQIAETQSFSGTDILKVRRLADQAYHAVDRLKKQERSQGKTPAQNRDAQESQSLADQRDVLMGNAPDNSRAPVNNPQQGPGQNQPEPQH